MAIHFHWIHFPLYLLNPDGQVDGQGTVRGGRVAVRFFILNEQVLEEQGNDFLSWILT